MNLPFILYLGFSFVISDDICLRHMKELILYHICKANINDFWQQIDVAVVDGCIYTGTGINITGTVISFGAPDGKEPDLDTFLKFCADRIR